MAIKIILIMTITSKDFYDLLIYLKSNFLYLYQFSNIIYFYFNNQHMRSLLKLRFPFSSRKLGIADTAKVIQDKILGISQVVHLVLNLE